MAVEVTVLPHPDSPTRPWISDSLTDRSTPRSARDTGPSRSRWKLTASPRTARRASGSHQPILILGLSTL